MSDVYLAKIAEADDRLASGTEILGVYSSLNAAWDAAIAEGPQTACVTRHGLDSRDYGEDVRWREWSNTERAYVTMTAAEQEAKRRGGRRTASG